MRKIVQKKWSFNNEKKCQERPIARMQDFAPFIPELLGALSGPQTVKGAEQACSAWQTAVPSASICLLLFNEDLLNIKCKGDPISRTSDTSETRNLCVIKVVLLACLLILIFSNSLNLFWHSHILTRILDLLYLPITSIKICSSIVNFFQNFVQYWYTGTGDPEFFFWS